MGFFQAKISKIGFFFPGETRFHGQNNLKEALKM